MGKRGIKLNIKIEINTIELILVFMIFHLPFSSIFVVLKYISLIHITI